MTSDFRIIDALSIGLRSLTANPRILLPYLALSVILPFMVFSFFPQASMRNFLALLANSNTYLVDGSPLTILSIFLVAGFTIAAVLFACWQALLADSRDGIVGELMYGFVAALLSLLVALVIYLVWSVLLSFALVTLGAAMGASLAVTDPGSAPRLGAAMLASMLLLSLPMLWLNARLCLAGPAMASTGSINPFTGLARSWQATAPAQWRIVFTLLLLQIVGLILFSAIFAGTTALIIGSDGTSWHDWVVTLAWLLTTALFFCLYVAVPIGLWRSLQPTVDSEVFS